MEKMWAGRFQKTSDQILNDFNSSISFDARMYRQDIVGSIAHATMLGEEGIIDKNEAQKLVAELEKMRWQLDNGELHVDSDAEDIHMFIESELTKRLGDTGKRLHTARSRNDQVALDIKMYLQNQAKEIKKQVCELTETMLCIASEHVCTIMPGYTHLQRAQPVTFAHHIMAYVQMLLRDIDRINAWYDRSDTMPLGSGALAATTYPINRQRVCDLLGFSRVTENSLDGVSDRDFCLELAFLISLLMTHLSRLAEELILWSSWEFKFIELDDAFATGSSIMPQKKNPDIAELIRGKAARTIGDLTTLLVMMKGTPLAYNKDMQEDKQAVFDVVDTVKICVQTLTPMLKTMKVCKQNMRNAAAKGFINATDCADYLVRKGMPFRDAYKITGQLVALCIERNDTLETLPLSFYQQLCPVFDKSIFDAISLDVCVNERKVYGGPAPETAKAQIENGYCKLRELSREHQ